MTAAALLLMLALGAVALIIAAATGGLDIYKTKACPHCAETIKRAAKVCRYCGRDLESV